MDRFDERLINTLTGCLTAVVGGVLILTPIFLYQDAKITREALNEQCGTSYSTMDILFAGPTLKDLCKMKNQELLIKQ